jgi:hypothetical protein
MQTLSLGSWWGHFFQHPVQFYKVPENDYSGMLVDGGAIKMIDRFLPSIYMYG